MFTLTQVQYIFDYSALAFYQCVEISRQAAVQRTAQVASAATTMVNKEARMANKTKETILTAGIEASVFNKELTGEAYKAAFDHQFILSMKQGLEALFGVENIADYDKKNQSPPKLPLILNTCLEENQSPSNQIPTFKSSFISNLNFFPPITTQQNAIRNVDESLKVLERPKI